MTWNEALQDEIIEAQTDLLRLAKATGDDLVALLDKSDADIKALLLDLESSGAVTDAQYAEIRKAQELIAQRRAEAWGQVSLDLTSRVNEIAIEAHGGLMSAILTATGGEIVPTVVATSALVSIAESRPFEGRILSEWAGKLQSDDLARFARTIQLGMVRGAAPAQIARDIYGTGGVAEMGRSAIMAVVRTATNHVANEAQALFVAQNEWLTRERYVATLDARTTRQCGALDGKVFDAGEGPRPPLHYNCRSRRVPFIDGDAYAKGGRGQVSASRSGAARAYEEAGRPKGGFEAFRRKYFRDRAGPVPADTTYGQWLKSRPEALQDDILGPTRGKLFRDGGLKIEQFTTEGGRTLTLAELRAKHAAAFKRAGLTEE